MQHLRASRVHSAEIEEGSTGKREGSIGKRGGGSTGKQKEEALAKEKEEEYVVRC